jgi:hypothetical protein
VIDDGNPMAELHPDLYLAPGDVVVAKPPSAVVNTP